MDANLLRDEKGQQRRDPSRSVTDSSCIKLLPLSAQRHNFSCADDLFNLTRYIPATSRTRPTHLEATLTVLPNSSLVLLFEFEKLILRYTEYPPDANRGFDVPPAVFVLPPLPELGSTTDVRERRVYTTSTLMSLATPDFSMPYNVIILTGTVIALIFSSIVNLLVRRFVVVRLKPRRKEETETERTKLE